MKVEELLEAGLPGVKVAQSKKTQKKLRKNGEMEIAGHYHKKGGDWEDTTVTQPKKKWRHTATKKSRHDCVYHNRKHIMSRSNKARKQKNHFNRPTWRDFGGWILESNKEQRRRIKQEVDKALRDPDHEVIAELKGPKGAYDWC